MFDEDEDDMADFIEEDSPDEEDREREDRQARKSREKQRKQQRRAEGFVLSNLDITAEYVAENVAKIWLHCVLMVSLTLQSLGRNTRGLRRRS